MNCWKTINISRDIGTQRMTFISMLIMLISFVVLYLLLSILNSSVHLSADGIFLFILSLFLTEPFHKFLHAVPDLLLLKKVKFKIELKFKIFPSLHVIYGQNLSRTLSILSYLLPTFFITIPLIIASFYYPTHMHYFIIIASYNIGLSIPDYIYVFLCLKAPRRCIIENNSHGLDILIRKNS